MDSEPQFKVFTINPLPDGLPLNKILDPDRMIDAIRVSISNNSEQTLVLNSLDTAWGNVGTILNQGGLIIQKTGRILHLGNPNELGIAKREFAEVELTAHGVRDWFGENSDIYEAYLKDTRDTGILRVIYPEFINYFRYGSYNLRTSPHIHFLKNQNNRLSYQTQRAAEFYVELFANNIGQVFNEHGIQVVDQFGKSLNNSFARQIMWDVIRRNQLGEG